MPPATVAGIIFLVAALSPGLVYHRVLGRFLERDTRSTLIEVVELATVGVLASLTSIILVAAVGESGSAFLPLRSLGADSDQLLRQPWRLVLTATLAIVFSLVIAASCGWAVARLSRRQASRIREGSAWSGVLARKRGGRPSFLAVEIDDGRLIEGFLRAITVVDDPQRDVIVLRRPIAVTGPGKVRRKEIDEDFVMIPRANIKLIHGKYI